MYFICALSVLIVHLANTIRCNHFVGKFIDFRILNKNIMTSYKVISLVIKEGNALDNDYTTVYTKIQPATVFVTDSNLFKTTDFFISFEKS